MRWGVRVADAGLAVAAVAGVLCIVLAIAAVVFDVRVTLFSTGSMSPTIPAGSAAVARGIPAADVRVGDVVTVERPGRLPITHRVTSVAPVPDGMPEARRITMRGDANAVEDPFPYDVERVRVVVFSVPGIAPVLSAAGTPAVMAGVTLAATVLVVAVFWPRRRPGPRRGRGGRGGSIAGAIALVGVMAAAPPVATEAAWADAESAAGAVSALTATPPSGIRCTQSGLLVPASLAWDPAPAGAAVTGYRWTMVGASNRSGTLAASATSLTLNANLVELGTSTFTLYAVRADGWEKAGTTATIGFVSLVLGLTSSCSVP